MKGRFIFWRELIINSQLKVPFDVVHIDAHADLGLGDGSWAFIFQYVLRLPVEKRMWIERYRYRAKKHERFSSGNYLLHAIACEWINSLTYVTHPDRDGDDFLQDTMTDCDDNGGFIQLKCFNRPINWEKEIVEQEFVCQPEVPLNVVKNYFYYVEPRLADFDYVVFSQSPSYTPKSADFIIDVIKEYIVEI